MDILSASHNDDTIAWYENNGAADPSFSAADIATSADCAKGVFAADMDGDGDLDLYLVSGGNEYDKGSKWYQDRLLFNDGSGNFENKENRLPKILVNGCIVRPSDFDMDGTCDVIDPDDDNDGIIDALDAFDKDPSEWQDRNNDGKGDIANPLSVMDHINLNPGITIVGAGIILGLIAGILTYISSNRKKNNGQKLVQNTTEENWDFEK